MSRGNSKLQIRNSTAEFLIFTAQSDGRSIEVRYEDETIWLPQKLIATLFDVAVPTINEHLKNIFEQGEITRKATIRKFRIVQVEGSRKVARNIDFYNLDAISRRGMVEEEVKEAKAFDDPDLVKICLELIEALKNTREGQKVIGKYNINLKDSKVGVVGDNANIGEMKL